MTEALSRPALSAMIGAIYDCALDPSRWNNVLADIRDALHCETAALYLLDPRSHRFLMSKVAGLEESYWWDQLDKYAPLINTWLVESLASGRSLDLPHLMSRHLPRELVYGSAYFQERLKPRGIVDLMQLYLVHTPTRHAGLGFGRHEREGNFTDGEIELGALLLPHLRRAVVISNVLDVHTIERARMAEALDALRCAVVLVDAGASILHANNSAGDMLRECGGPIQATRGILEATAPSATRELRAAIRHAAEDEVGIGKTGLAIRLTDEGVPPIFAHVLPLSGGDLRTQLQPPAVAAVVIGRPADDQDAAEATAAAFGLTAAETRVLAGLLAGRTLAETAGALRIAVTTARTHLDSIFAKTGVARQAELMRLAARLLPPTRSRGSRRSRVGVQPARRAERARRTECKSD